MLFFDDMMYLQGRKMAEGRGEVGVGRGGLQPLPHLQMQCLQGFLMQLILMA